MPVGKRKRPSLKIKRLVRLCKRFPAFWPCLPAQPSQEKAFPFTKPVSSHVKTIGKHINNALREELHGVATVANFAIVQNEGVSAQIYTRSISRQLSLDLQRHNAQYRPVAIDVFPNAHDRFLCLDDTVYHIGASLKDLGKKWFAFNRMEIGGDALLKKI